MAYVTVIERPAAIVSLGDAKLHLRLDSSDHDALVASYIDAAQRHVDGPQGWLGRAVMPQRLRLTMDGCDIYPGADIILPFPPFIALLSFGYTDAAGESQTHPVDASSIVVTRCGARARLLPAYGASWPVPRRSPDAVRIEWTAGYDNAADIEPVRLAVLMLVAHWFEHREAVSPASMAEMPMAVEALLSPYRLWGA